MAASSFLSSSNVLFPSSCSFFFSRATPEASLEMDSALAALDTALSMAAWRFRSSWSAFCAAASASVALAATSAFCLEAERAMPFFAIMSSSAASRSRILASSSSFFFSRSACIRFRVSAIASSLTVTIFCRSSTSSPKAFHFCRALSKSPVSDKCLVAAFSASSISLRLVAASAWLWFVLTSTSFIRFIFSVARFWASTFFSFAATSASSRAFSWLCMARRAR
mmetsp:Transcript_12864/g.29362  ORF Transcript_12864/g.29362 Transcript_12864/m.29362 type:complete len:224 (+) Transcript_12864:408-1079(+)